MIPNNRQAKIKQSGTQFWNITVILPFTNNFTIKHSKRNFAFLLSWCQVSEIVSVIMNLTYLHCYISQIICYSKLSIIFFFNLQMKNISSTWTNMHEVRCISYLLKHFTVFSYPISHFIFLHMRPKNCNLDSIHLSITLVNLSPMSLVNLLFSFLQFPENFDRFDR